MKYRKNRNGEPISILGYGCMRFTTKAGSIDINKAEKAEWLWNHDDGDTYGYYQEVLNEVK